MKGDTQNRRKEKDDDCHNKQAIQNAGDEWAGFRLFLKIMASQETIAFVCVAQRNSDRNGGKKRPTPREEGKEAPEGGEKARAADGESEQMRGEKRSRKTMRRMREKRECERKKSVCVHQQGGTWNDEAQMLLGAGTCLIAPGRQAWGGQ